MNLIIPHPRMRRFAPLLLVLVSAAAVVAAYLQALNYPFISDDDIYIVNNIKLAGLHLSELWRLFTGPYNPASEFLPLRDLSYWFDMALFGLNPAAFRLHNIFLYLLCLPLVYATTLELWRYFRPADAASAPWAAAIVTALFALHPALVEPVVWASGRKYVLPNLFSMLALWLAVHARREPGLSTPYAAAALIVFAAVMLSKSSYVAVAPVIALLWVLFWFDTPKPERRRSQLLWPLAILFLAGFLFLIFIAASGGAGATGMPFYFGIEVVTRTLAVLGWLIRLAISPESRHIFYPVFEGPYFPIMVALGGVVLAAAVIGGVALLRKRSLEGFALIAFLLLCMPYMQLIPYLAPSLVQDRYLALAAWPTMLLMVALCWRLKPMPRAILLLAIALTWSFQTIERSRDWHSYNALIEADLRAYPGYYMPAAYKIAVVQLPQELFHEAMETANGITTPEFRGIMVKQIKAAYAVRVTAVTTGKPLEAVSLLGELWSDIKQPPPVQAKWNSPINFLLRKRQDMLAIEWGYLAEHFPEDALIRYNAGLSQLIVARYEDAAVHLRAATESQRLPETARGTAFYNLGFALMNSGHVTEAEAPLRIALEQWVPDLRAHCLLSEVYKQTKRLEEAAQAAANCPDRTSNKETLP